MKVIDRTHHSLRFSNDADRYECDLHEYNLGEKDFSVSETIGKGNNCTAVYFFDSYADAYVAYEQVYARTAKRIQNAIALALAYIE